MDYKKFNEIFNKAIFEKSKPDLISKIAKYPQRYVGIFRPTKPKAKIIQNLLQSHEIKFGDAFEILIEQYLKENGFDILDKNFKDNKDDLQIDQIFTDKKTIFFIEQKIRDDHDSAKKRGQIDNFEKKICAINSKYNNKQLKGFFYFIDDKFDKNRNFYKEEIEKLSDCYKIDLCLSYGKDLFDKLHKRQIWEEILSHLKEWKNNIPDLPEVNFDKNPLISFEEIKDLSPAIYRKLFSNNDLQYVLAVLFPEAKTLQLLSKYCTDKQKQPIYKTLNNLCEQIINKIKSNIV